MAEGMRTRPRLLFGGVIAWWAVAMASSYRAAESTSAVPALSRGSRAGKFFTPGIDELFVRCLGPLAIIALGAYAQFPLFAGNAAEMGGQAGSFGRFGRGGGDHA